MRGEGAWASRSKSERQGSVSHAPLETAVRDDGGGWMGAVDGVVVMVSVG